MINFKYTKDGLAAIATGNQLIIDKIAFGNNGYTPSASATALKSEIVKITPISVSAKDNKITLVNQLSGAQEFSIREIGIYLKNGMLLCIWSSATQIAGEKVADTTFKITVIVQLDGIDSSNVSFSVNNFAEAELHQHTNDENNPHGVSAVQIGAASAKHTHEWSKITGKPVLFPPAEHTQSWSSIIAKPEKFTPAAHTHEWSKITGKPVLFPPAEHTQSWSSIISKPTKFTPAAHTHTVAALPFDLGLGQGQTWQDVTNSRSVGVTYTNNSGRTIAVMTGYLNFSALEISGLSAANNSTNNTDQITTFIVPHGDTYKPRHNAVHKVYELR